MCSSLFPQETSEETGGNNQSSQIINRSNACTYSTNLKHVTSHSLASVSITTTTWEFLLDSQAFEYQYSGKKLPTH